MSVVVIGLNHRTAPLDLLERMTVGDGQLPRPCTTSARREHISEAVVLSTCNRTEVYAVAERFHGAYSDIRGLPGRLLVPAARGLRRPPLRPLRLGRCRPPVLGDGRARLGGAGRERDPGPGQAGLGAGPRGGRRRPGLNLLLRHAVEAGKRARTETGIGRKVASVSQAAVAMAAERLGGLDGKAVLVLGAGDMGEGMAVALAGAGGRRQVLVANRTWPTPASWPPASAAEPVPSSTCPTRSPTSTCCSRRRARRRRCSSARPRAGHGRAGPPAADRRHRRAPRRRSGGRPTSTG